MRSLRASKKASGEDRIWTAGEKERECAQHRSLHGIPIRPGLQRQLIELRDHFNLYEHNFPFEMGE